MNDSAELNDRLAKLLARRGQELVEGLVGEIRILHREIAGMEREIAALAHNQVARHRWLVLDTPANEIGRLPRAVVISSDQMLNARDGFYPMECTDTGQPFRWTGPSIVFSFDLFVDRVHGADLELEALNFMDFERQKNVSLLVDGESVPVKLARGGSRFLVSATLPPRAGNTATNLAFLLPTVISPPESKDTRLLGLAFGRLTVTARGMQGASLVEVGGRDSEVGSSANRRDAQKSA